MDIKAMHEMIETLAMCAKSEFDKKGVEKIDTKEMSEVIDMIKDLAEAMYYRTVTVAMEEYGEDEEDGRRGYSGQPRSKTSGRYMSRGDGRRNNCGRRGYEDEVMHYDDMEYMRDMDKGLNRMYYSDGNYSGNMSNTSRTESARKGYEETKTKNDNSPEGKKKAMEHLDHYMKELSEDMTEMIGKMDNSEKTLLKTKLQGLVQKIQ